MKMMTMTMMMMIIIIIIDDEQCLVAQSFTPTLPQIQKTYH